MTLNEVRMFCRWIEWTQIEQEVIPLDQEKMMAALNWNGHHRDRKKQTKKTFRLNPHDLIMD